MSGSSSSYVRVTLSKSFSNDPRYYLKEAHLNLPRDSLTTAVISILCVHW